LQDFRIMLWSLTVARVAGTAVRIHVTFLLFLAWLWASYYQQGGTQAAWDGVIFVSLLFLCVLLHEFGHVFAARRYGIKTPDITLWPFGGIASLERIPEKPSQEFFVAIAGPLVNVVIAAALIAYLGFTQVDANALARIEDPNNSMVVKLAGANIFLVLFNLIPAFPMDGGRVLRALLATRYSFGRATELAAMVGQGFAVAFGILGIFTNPMLIVIAVFVFLAASAEAGHAQLRDVSRGALVSDAMITKFLALNTQATVDEAANALIQTTQKEFPIVDGAGKLRGVLTRNAMIKAMKEKGPQCPVLEATDMEIPTVSARATLESAIKILTESRAPAIGATDAADRLVGLLTAENLGEMMMVRAARPKNYEGPWRRRLG
jgi:Zn-dependent protease/CBS domain-containing protein